MTRQRLTREQQEFYETNGYLIGMPAIFDEQEVEQLNAGFNKTVGMLNEGEVPSDIMGWHQTSRWQYNICANPQILDYVEGLLGPDFYLWGSEFITKAPKSEKVVPWHQDSYYWPLTPHNSVTVWLAFTDVDEGNAAMKVIPGTHKGGLVQHKIADEESILSFQLSDGTFREDSAVTLSIPAGGVSLHDDAIVHGSPANESDRWRIGFVIRYSSTDVKCDLEKNPNFKAYLMRGEDRYQHNPQGEIPTVDFARPESSKRIRKR
ncbi:phytanoyl-CoA dioxygenase family protein [Paenibacillus eucommiae]|uniref:Ectoine hydroxylase-related dioxygenase (Phytanoyl-CoA dioxygenase family) n=1 Tax=Paenibacillus eucommiae TaxID=1355755 RepID=A0ABS4ISR2_9BACL|nr:phytanoyl-CoA dioxygenase family protein [Paenibacillus eucommiae]MBP1990617.1 ectoine hydroxylase-related dioxygenase (phytanoyl-CoA dioxygenase family) [Paenibacillus eucommiae]